jgi:integrase
MGLTAKELESLTPADTGRKISDGDGLHGLIRVSKGGIISVLFRWRFRHGGKYHDFTCGTWKKGVSLPSIRKQRDAAATILGTGRNPNDERKLIKEQAAAEQKTELARLEAEKATLRTLDSALQEWYDSKEIRDRKDGGAYLKRAIAKDVQPKLKDVPVSSITKTMLSDILQTLAKTAPVMANRLHAGLNQFFRYCCDEREWIVKNPLDGTKRAKIGGKEESRERTLCDPINPDKHELKELQEAMSKAKLQDQTKAALWIMLGTACRIGEITFARWEDVDLNARRWTIPAENSKNGKPLTVNLSDFVIPHFKTLKEASNGSEWLFPAKIGKRVDNKRPNNETTQATQDKGPVCVKSITKQVGDRQRDTPIKGRSKAVGTLRLSGGHWTPHDLRRTAATIMGHCGVLSEIIDRCLNHTEGSKLKKTYQRQEPRQQMQEAWNLLGQRVETLLSESNVAVGNFGNKAA